MNTNKSLNSGELGLKDPAEVIPLLYPSITELI
jgi:hypothetical protein